MEVIPSINLIAFTVALSFLFYCSHFIPFLYLDTPYFSAIIARCGSSSVGRAPSC